jgi:hypothetical protein
MLRVKIKSLAVEARIIRREELRTHGALREELYMHRIHDVRSEARASCLAYGFIRGRTLDQMERGRTMLDPATQKRVDALMKKYGPKPSLAKAA